MKQENQIAICTLARGYIFEWKYELLINRNNYIKRNILDKTKLSPQIIIFHEGNISPKHQKYIKEKSEIKDLEFVNVANTFTKKNIGKSTFCSETKLSKKFKHGYKCMCQFWFSDFIEYTKNYKYVIRVDEDCLIDYFPLDSFMDELNKGEIKYITPLMYGRDSEGVTNGLSDFCQYFTKKYNLAKSPRLDLGPYTNVFIMNADFFRNDDIYKAFSREVTDTGCIHINRWGDLPLWGCLLSMHEQGILLESRSIRYAHESHDLLINP